MHRRLTLEATVYTLDQLHVPDAPQVALAGRSNVGKSSLLNCLAGARKLAKTSSTPGKTRSLNFYRVEPGGYYIVDLPGYGYAKTAKTERAKWATLIERYLRNAGDLRAVVALLDCRLEPQKLDLELTGYLASQSIPLLPVLTKADKCKQKDRTQRQRQWRTILRTAGDPLLFSSATGHGREALWRRLDDLCAVQVEAPESAEESPSDSS